MFNGAYDLWNNILYCTLITIYKAVWKRRPRDIRPSIVILNGNLDKQIKKYIL